VSKLAIAISKMEGFGIPGAVPTRDNNPGDLRHSPHSSHAGEGPDDIGEIDSPADGWADLDRQLAIDAARGWTLQQLVYTYAPPNENNSANYLKFLDEQLGCSPFTTVSDALALG
jgi:hypothetical protein